MNEHYHFQFERLEKLLEWDFPILLLGESGVGKTFMVRQYARKYNLNLYEEAYKEDFIFGATEEQVISEKARKFVEEGGIYLIDEVDKISNKKVVALIDFMESVENKKIRLRGDASINIGKVQIIAIANDYKKIEDALYQRFLGRLNVEEDQNLKFDILPHPEQKDFLKVYESVIKKVPLRVVGKKFAKINPEWPDEILKTQLEVLFPEIITAYGYNRNKGNIGGRLKLIYEKEFKGRKQGINVFVKKRGLAKEFYLEYKAMKDKKLVCEFEKRIKNFSGVTVIRRDAVETMSYYIGNVSVSIEEGFELTMMYTDSLYDNCNDFIFLNFEKSQNVILICLKHSRIPGDMSVWVDEAVHYAEYAAIIDLRNKTFASLQPKNEDVPKLLVDKLLEFKDSNEINWDEVKTAVKEFSENEINMQKEESMEKLNVDALNGY